MPSLILAILAAAAGAILTWLIQRARMAPHLAERDGLRLRAEELQRALQAASDAQRQLAETTAAQAADLEGLRKELATRLDAHQRMETELRRQLDAQLNQMNALETQRRDLQNQIADLQVQSAGVQRVEAAFEEARSRMVETFQAHAARALESSGSTFLAMAKEVLAKAQGEAKGDLEARQTAIAQLLEPLKQGLGTMDQQVRDLHEARKTGEAQLQQQIQNLLEVQQRLQGETGRLANALRKPSVRGRWGELQLQNLVELAGMTEHVDFLTQVSVKVDEDRRRPDLLVRLPGGKCIAVDAKTPLGAYLDALEAVGEEEKQAQLAKLPGLIRTHVSQLADKRYYEGLTESPDFVVLFLHGEGPFALACEKDPGLLQDALRQNVLLATPVTLMALLKSAAYGWQQQRIQENAEEIRRTAAELVKRLATMADHIGDLGEHLGKATGSYNAFAGSLERMVLPQARRIQALGVQAYTRKGELIELPALDALHEAPRALDADLLTSFDPASSPAPSTESEA